MRGISALEQCAFQDNNARVRYSFYSFRMSSCSVRALRRVASDLRSFQDGRMALEAVDTFVITLEYYLLSWYQVHHQKFVHILLGLISHTEPFFSLWYIY